MMKPLLMFLLFLYTVNAFAGYGGYIGTHDNRRYGSLSEPEYNSVVKLTVGGGRCTGGFVSKNAILTNSHCAVLCKNGCVAEFWNGSALETSNAKIAAYVEKHETLNGKDWAILLSDKESNFYKSVSPTTTPGQVLRGGFGALRIIEDNEIPFLQNLYSQVYKDPETIRECKTKGKMDVSCVNKRVDKKLKQIGKQPLFKDADNFKVQNCNIIGDKEGTDGKMVQTNCDSAGGDSGAPLLRGNQIVAINNSGQQMVFGNTDKNANAVKTQNFYPYLLVYQHVNNSALTTHISENRNNNTLKPNNNTEPTVVSSQNNEEQIIQQFLQQRLQEFDCD